MMMMMMMTIFLSNDVDAAAVDAAATNDNNVHIQTNSYPLSSRIQKGKQVDIYLSE
jgi:hypothetical protein